MNYIKILLVLNIFFIIKNIYQYITKKTHVNNSIIEPIYVPIINNYEDELNKLNNMVLTDIIEKLTWNNYELLMFYD
jgi:LPS O-antigen subunit length determinant protein (WzzB/FepE family)